MIEKNVTESLEAVVLARSSSPLKSTYEAAASLSEFELTKILLDKMEERKSHLRTNYKKKLYDALMTETKIKTPLLDQTEGRNEGSQARKLSHPKILDRSSSRDQKLYKFREGDFPRLCLQDIDDMLLLLVQQKLTNLTIDKRSNLRNRATYTAYSDPKGVIYMDQNNINRLMRANELHKFIDGTLDDVRSALNDIAKGIRMEYLPKRK
ncbi:hypothetical protein Tco_1295153 [Tanacetum coccineum]